MTTNTMSGPEETTRLKGDIFKFVEESVRRCIFRQTVLAAREAFADVSPDKLQNMIDEAVDDIRAKRYRDRAERSLCS